MRALFHFIVGTFLTLFCLILINFTIIRHFPTDPALIQAGEYATQQQYEAARQSLGLDKPFWQQFGAYLQQLGQGRLGYSLTTKHPIEQDLKQAIPATFELATCAMLLATICALPLGMAAALYQHRWVDQGVRLLSLLGSSTSVFWLGLMALVIFYVRLDWLPGPGRVSDFFDIPPGGGSVLWEALLQKDWPLFYSALQHLVLPAGTLAFFKVGQLSRLFRSFVLEQLSQDYVLVAQIKGQKPWTILWRHVLPNAGLPLITALGLSYATLLEGSTFVETIYLWPGLGFYLTQALLHADMAAILSTTLVIGSFFILVNQLADMLTLLLDPRRRRAHG